MVTLARRYAIKARYATPTNSNGTANNKQQEAEQQPASHRRRVGFDNVWDKLYDNMQILNHDQQKKNDWVVQGLFYIVQLTKTLHMRIYIPYSHTMYQLV
jgi:hypothetical protein